MMPHLPREFIPYLGTGLNIREDAPEEIKQKFKEWLKELEELKKQRVIEEGEW
jgi:ABC-type phosphate/phosphonate transport system substrate-binding protein